MGDVQMAEAEGEVQSNAANRGDEDRANVDDEASQKLKAKLEERVEKKEEQILKMEASVFQVANYYFVFQGVILTAIIKGSSSSLKCQHFWLPFLMSLIGAILNYGTLSIITDKYKECLDQLDDRTLILYRHLYPKTAETLHNKHKKKKARRRKILASSKFLFSIFALLNLFATWIIPCHT